MADLVEAYRPIVEIIQPDYVSIQVASVDPERTVELVGSEVLPELRRLAQLSATGANVGG